MRREFTSDGESAGPEACACARCVQRVRDLSTWVCWPPRLGGSLCRSAHAAPPAPTVGVLAPGPHCPAAIAWRSRFACRGRGRGHWGRAVSVLGHCSPPCRGQRAWPSPRGRGAGARASLAFPEGRFPEGPAASAAAAGSVPT